ncbi:O-antigen ligase family protein [Mucilaginibacter polytrichastri]|uniref:O-antigen ligase-related domain-containing protein n=1 Tax=Mucilaginibacter polytrichastri TaxID=1302689 RepID=A0A1Q6A378_9SPHI|nr:O-antigen ligase family protein [Mucilaginibacter polytrichastri]OKS88469.1 hypothetical protein RG47T_3936 [Mucilaginibacter polytrichastri]SFT12299.1 O-antigen ligase [Mucilaginibacter polytrichastri]
MEVLFKQILPIILFGYFFIFEYRKNKDIAGVIALFIGFITLSSNFAFLVYRTAFQLIEAWLIICYLVYYRFDFHLTKIGKALAVFLFFILFSFLGNKINSELYSSSLINFITIFFVIAYLYKTINDFDRLERILIFLKNLTFIVSAFTIVAFVFEGTRIELTTSNTNYLGYFLGLGFSVAIFFLNQKHGRLVVLVISAAILCTSSRIVMISSVVVAVIYIISNKRKLMVNIAIIAVVVIGAIGVINLTEYISSKRFTAINKDPSALVRVEITEASKNLVAKNPVNGVGYGQFQFQFSKYVGKNSEFLAATDKIVTHNDFLRVVDELGVPAFLFLVYLVLTQFLTLRKLPPNYRKLVSGLLISNVFFSTTHNNLNVFMFWFLLMLPTMVYYMLLKETYVKEIR